MSTLLYTVKIQISRQDYNLIKNYFQSIGSFEYLYSLEKEMSFTNKDSYLKYVNELCMNIRRTIAGIIGEKVITSIEDDCNFLKFKGSMLFITKKFKDYESTYLKPIEIENPENYIDIFNLFVDDQITKGKLYNKFGFSYQFSDDMLLNIFSIRTEVSILDPDYSFCWHTLPNYRIDRDINHHSEKRKLNYSIYPEIIKK